MLQTYFLSKSQKYLASFLTPSFVFIIYNEIESMFWGKVTSKTSLNIQRENNKQFTEINNPLHEQTYTKDNIQNVSSI